MPRVTTRPHQRPLRKIWIPSEDYRHIIMPVAADPNPAVVPPSELANGDVSTLMDKIGDVWPGLGRHQAWMRRRGMTDLFAHLSQFPGDDWQQRWLNSGLNDNARPARDLLDNDHHASNITFALGALCCLRVIRPSLPAFRSNYFSRYSEMFQVAEADPEFDRFCQITETTARSPHYARMARLDVATLLTTQQLHISDVTPASMVCYSRTCRDGSIGSHRHANFTGHSAWTALHTGGFFGPSVPSTLTAVLRSPQLTPEEMVASFHLRNQDVAAMLAAYLRRRSYGVDYTTLRGLAIRLCQVFWRSIEAINPDQADLQLSEETYQAWRAGVAVNPNGTPRKLIAGPLTGVRSMYLDIQGWAAAEPETWGRWAAPCPISLHDMKNLARERRRTKERMDDRVRRLQPHVPALVAEARRQYEYYTNLLEAARATEPDQLVDFPGRRFRRVFNSTDVRFEQLHGRRPVRVRDDDTGELIHLGRAEDNAFWCWAVVEVLRNTGARASEILELSQLDVRQYLRPNGEVIALLVIAPSKTDRERVIPMSAELFHVIAVIIRRLTAVNDGAIPLATRHDRENRVTTEPQPYLFQRRYGERDHVMTAGSMRQLLGKLKDTVAERLPQFTGIDISPHDFRRLLATDLANSGLPVHIGAALLGHLNLQTFHGYVTVFNEDVVRHYQEHLAKRRADRPAKEYRPVTDEEWHEFTKHFDKRKVELGQCGRPYATPCSHEHACVRCPMLQVDPKMIPRLDELEEDLLRRREQAEQRGWLGELEGIDLTLTFLKDKRDEARRLSRQPILTIGRRPPD